MHSHLVVVCPLQILYPGWWLSESRNHSGEGDVRVGHGDWLCASGLQEKRQLFGQWQHLEVRPLTIGSLSTPSFWPKTSPVFPEKFDRITQKNGKKSLDIFGQKIGFDKFLVYCLLPGGGDLFDTSSCLHEGRPFFQSTLMQLISSVIESFKQSSQPTCDFYTVYMRGNLQKNM